MRLIAASISFILLALPAFAGRVYNLQKDEDVSRLLYDRLKVSTIYRNGLLQEVLKYNNLTDETAKRLPVGAPVKIPDYVVIPATKELPVEKAPEETIATEVQEQPTTLNVLKWLSLGLKPAILAGDAKNSNTDFSLALIKASVEAGVGSRSERHELLFGVSGDYASLQKDDALKGNNSLFLLDTNFTYRYLVNTLWFGLHFNYGQRMVFSPKPDQKYEFLSPWLYGIGPTLAWNNFTVSYLLYPEQTIESGVKSKMNQGLMLMYELRNNDRAWRFIGAFNQNSTEEIDGQQFELGCRYVWYL